MAASAAAMVAAMIGLAIVLAVQVRANHELSAARDRERGPVRPRDGGHQAVPHRRQRGFPAQGTPVRRAAHQAAARGHEFFGKLEDQLKAHSDPRSRRAMAQAYDELAALTDKIGSQTEALELYHRELAIRRELARDAGRR